jgi:hypothetical protein
MPGRHLPPDPAAGDESTLGGYAAVHGRPPAFEGPDGLAYSVEILVEPTGDDARPWGAWLFFPRWRRQGAPGVSGHVESEIVAWGATEAAARAALAAWPLLAVKEQLDLLLTEARGDAPERRWWDAMRDEDGG